jgi:hypothetical protein
VPVVDRAGSQWPHIRRVRTPLLILILILAALLRFYRVDQPLIDAFSWRQASTAMMADNFYRTNPNILFPEVSWTGPGPNYQGREFQTLSYIVSLLYRVLGEHEQLGRMVATCFGVLGVFSMYHLVRRVWDEPHALAAAMLLAVMPGAIFIDRSFLPDPAMLGLTLTAMWLFVRAMQVGGTGNLAVAACVLSLAYLTKLPGATTLPAIIYVAVKTVRAAPSGKRGRRALAITVAIILALVPVAAYYAWAVYLGTSYPGSTHHVAGSANWVWKDGLLEWLQKAYFLESTLNNLVGWLWTPAVIGLVLVGFVVPPPGTKGKLPSAHEFDDPSRIPPQYALPPDLRWTFHFWIVGCVILYLIGARELTENVWNFHAFNGVAAALAGHGLVLVASLPSEFALGRRERRDDLSIPVAFVRRIPRGTFRVALFLVVIVAYGEWRLGPFYDSRHAQNGFLMGRALQHRSRPGDLVVTIADDVGDPIGIYSSGRRGWVFPQANYPKWKPWNLFPKDPKLTIKMFEELRESGAKWLGIVTHPMDDTPGARGFWTDQPAMVAHINRTCDFIEKNQAYVIYRILTPAEAAEKQRAFAAQTRASTQPATTTQSSTTQP